MENIRGLGGVGLDGNMDKGEKLREIAERIQVKGEGNKKEEEKKKSDGRNDRELKKN